MDTTSTLAAPAATATQANIQGNTIVGDSSTSPANPGGITDSAASRFLAQASMGASRSEIAWVKTLGYERWIEAQFLVPRTKTRWNWLTAHGFDAAEYRGTPSGFDAASWWKLCSSPDTLRQRIALALSEILVVGIDGLRGSWQAFAAAYYFDILEAHAFGNYRQLLEAVTLSPAMGEWLTYRGNVKGNPKTGSLPDENYAREIMQLFTIGLVELNTDGTPRLVGGVTQPTYDQDDVMGLARVWTGWNWNLPGIGEPHTPTTPDFQGQPMVQIAARHETGEKVFLDTIIPAGTDGTTSMHIALDALFNHPNVGPFIGKQLIQRLVTSNPSPAYVGRVAAAFNGSAGGVRGDLRAVIRAILLDEEARAAPGGDASPAGGCKLREPMLRFCQWARAYHATAANDEWSIGNTSDPARRLGQSPLRSPTVFNFFRPGYAPPGSAVAKAGLVAPEFQITNETSVVGYVNFMQRAIASGVGDVIANYGNLLPLAGNAQTLLTEINTVLAAGQIGAGNLQSMVGAVDSMPRSDSAAVARRVYAALLLVMASPEYIVQK